MNKLIVVINPNNKDVGNFNQEITYIDELFYNECKTNLNLKDINRLNASDYIYRNYSDSEIAMLLISHFEKLNKTVLLSGLVKEGVINYLKHRQLLKIKPCSKWPSHSASERVRY